MPKDGKELCCRPRVFGGKAYKSDGGEADARAAQADAALESPPRTPSRWQQPVTDLEGSLFSRLNAFSSKVPSILEIPCSSRSQRK